MSMILIFSSIFVLLLVGPSSGDASCSSIDEYYVSSRGTDEQDCLKPGNISRPCGTLSYLVNYIHKCAEFFILDDSFILQEEVKFYTHSYVTVTGIKGIVNIHCEGHAGFILSYCNFSRFVNIHFEGCQVDVSLYLDPQDIGYTLSTNLSTVFFTHSSNVQVINCSFASREGSAILLVNVAGFVSIEGSTFSGNKSVRTVQYSRSGGIVMRQHPNYNYNTTVQVVSCSFNVNVNVNLLPNSSCSDSGGAIDVHVASSQWVNVSFIIDASNFSQNYACRGGAVRMSLYGKECHLDATIINSSFSNNEATTSGGAILFSSYNDFIGHTYPQGTLNSYGQVLVKNCEFIENHAEWGGGLAVYCVDCKKCNSTISTLITACEWRNNTASESGFAIGLSGTSNPVIKRCNIVLTISDNCTFYGNTFSSYYGAIGVVSVQDADVRFGNGTSAKYVNNIGTVLLLRSDSRAEFYGEVLFERNVGVMGGAILIQTNSKIYVGSHSEVYFTDNKAFVNGGAIYSDVVDYGCVIEFDSNTLPNITNIYFAHNLVNSWNQSIFIKDSKSCEKHKDLILYGFNYTPPDAFQVMFPVDEVILDVFPKPQEEELLELMLGEPFYLKPVELSDIFNTSATGVGYMYYHQVNYPNIQLAVIGPHTVGFDKFMGTITFSVIGPKVTVSSITLNISFFFHKQSSYHVGSNTVSVKVVPCRLGYQYSNGTCTCVVSDKVKCPSDSRQLCVKYHYWYSNDTHDVYPCPTRFCEYQNQRCPSGVKNCFNSTGYCSINKESDVCWKGRDGVLCSECREGFSFTIGAFKCVNTTATCSSKNTALVMILLLIYWTMFSVALLVILSLQISIGSGFMYGIIYYFSVVSLYTNENSLFSESWMRYVLRVCVALTQMDCYDLVGMMLPYCFAQSWTTELPHKLFQYVGPVFVVIVITAFVLASSYCRFPKCLRLSQSSPIHAICMLVLMSYTSLSQTSFQLLLSTSFNNSVRVKIAPSIRYFSGAHIPYALVALLLEVFISIPICVFLLSAPCISRRINLVKYKLKPIVDEFQACYRPECRWFAGYYFLARQLVYFTHGVFSETIPQVNVLLVLLNIAIWTIHSSFQPYKKIWLNILDTVLLTDLVLLSSSVVGQSLDLVSKVNIFFQQTALPYVLILVPACYLIGTLIAIFGHKLFYRRNILKVASMFRLNRTPLSKGESENSLDQNDYLHVGYEDSYYQDDGLREPLLEDNSIEGSSKRSTNHSNYEGTRNFGFRNQQRYSQGFTSSSFRVAGLTNFPPKLYKPNTK